MNLPFCRVFIQRTQNEFAGAIQKIMRFLGIENRIIHPTRHLARKLSCSPAELCKLSFTLDLGRCPKT
ncbi:hypothetical protein D3C76_1839350 [compost metagenome]